MAVINDSEDRLARIQGFLNIRNLNSVNLSPDGNKIACVTTITDLNKNRRNDYITLVSDAWQEHSVVAEGAAPVWSPDGSQIAYEGEEQGQSGIWIYHLPSGKKRFLAPLYHSAYFIDHLTEKNFAWSPDGRHIAYLSTAAFSPAHEEEKDVKVIGRLLYKSKGGVGRPFFADDRLTHIWLIPVAGGDPQVITPGAYNEHSISWSPDSTHITFISNHSPDPDNNQKNDLWTVDIKTKMLTRLTEGPGTAFRPEWSPDGKHIAYLATISPVSTNDSQSDDMHLYLIEANGGFPRCITRSLDRRVEKFRWHPDGNSIFFTAGNHGAIPLYKVSVRPAEITTMFDGKFQLLDFSVDATGGAIALLKTDTSNPAEIFRLSTTQQDLIRITNLNEKREPTRSFTDAEDFWFKSFDGTAVQGWLIPPAAFNPARTYPLILVIHGGPHNMYGFAFDTTMQALSAHGYGVVFINPRGSSGYGQNFSNGNVLNWGGADYRDLMAGLNCAIEKHKWIDPERLGVTGQSYGGYMTNWIITQTNRFKAAVVDGGISNLISFGGTSLYHSLMESEFNGNIYDNFPLLWQWSPLRNVKNVKTPTLFLHGEKDNEVPVSQAEEMFIALKKLGVHTTLVQYLGEGHGWRPDLKPKARLDLLNRMLNWFDTHVMTPP